MIRAAVICCLIPSAALAAPDRPDLLRFTNGDQLHGTFLGVKEGAQAVWKREDLAAPVEFKTSGIRHVVLHGGRPLKSLGTLSHAGLVNGDRLPGTVIAMDDENITLETECAGTLRIPRRQVSMLAPNPLGGRVHYHGPFSEDGWKSTHASFPDGLPAVEDDEEDEKDGEDGDDGDLPGRWEFSGSAWYWKGGRAGTALLHRDAMTDRSVLRFDLAWKNRLNIAVGFHADMFVPPPKEAKAPKDEKEEKPEKPVRRAFVPGDSSDLPRAFGNSYVLQMYSSYLMLYRTSVDEDGDNSMERVQLNNNNIRLGDSGKASVEIRSNRLTGGISLFINDEFVSQWSEGGPGAREGGSFAGKGSGFGFVVQADESPVRISDIVVSEWNGMPDSARSLEVDDQDVVLMANGTDRFAGKVTGLEADGRLVFEGKHGRFIFPLAEVAEIRFARDRLATAPPEPADNIVVRMDPIGTISGRPVSGDGRNIGVQSPILGALNVSTGAAVMLEFNASNQIIDDWDADF